MIIVFVDDSGTEVAADVTRIEQGTGRDYHSILFWQGDNSLPNKIKLNTCISTTLLPNG